MAYNPQPLTFNIGVLPTLQSVSDLATDEARFWQSIIERADKYYRVHAQLLATDQQKQDAGVDTTTYTTDAYRLDTLKDTAFAVYTLLTGGTPGTLPDMRDFCAQVTFRP